jgi:hypothetical protein
VNDEVTCAAGCGACCDPVRLFGPLTEVIARTDSGVSGLPDPTTEQGWAAWRARGWSPFERDGAAWAYANQLNSDFARAHWTQLLGPEEEKWGTTSRNHCDAFDPHTRSCTVHDGGAPPICTGYPRYGQPAGDPSIAYGDGMEPACSYNADVRTMLPIIEVRTGR